MPRLISMLCVAFLLLAGIAQAASTIVVTGQADVLVIPDEIVVNVGVSHQMTDLNEAKANNDKVIKALIAKAAAANVPKDKVRTDNLSISPYYDTNSKHSSASTELKGYQVSQNLAVVLATTSAYEAFVAGALAAGANRINDVTYQTSQVRKHRDAARESALIAAKQKGEAMAKVLGLTIGRAVTITEKRSGSSMRSPSGANYMQNTVQAAADDGLEGGEATAVGRVRIGAEVEVVFELK